MAGTPSYMSPERVNGTMIDARSDIFCLRVILYELLTGRKPFTGETIQNLMFAIIESTPERRSVVDEKVNATWDEVLRKALAQDRGDRHATVKEFAQAVRDVPELKRGSTAKQGPLGGCLARRGEAAAEGA